MAGLAQIGEHLREAAGPAESLRVARRHRPVTDMSLGIVLAETIAAPSCGQQRRLPLRIASGVQGADDVEVREVRQGVPTADTLDVFKEEQVLAVRTVERLHCWAFAGKSSLGMHAVMPPYTRGSGVATGGCTPT